MQHSCILEQCARSKSVNNLLEFKEVFQHFQSASGVGHHVFLLQYLCFNKYQQTLFRLQSNQNGQNYLI
jgi:hypothetical protein